MPLDRDEDAARKRLAAATARDLAIPRLSPANLRRRRECLADAETFLRTCFGGVFFQPFTPTRRQMLDAIIHAGRYGGDQAIAAPRGDGKTRLALFGSLWLALRGDIRFPLVVAKSASRAERELKNLKEAIRDSDSFAVLFPEVALPIRALGGWSSRARQQTVHGRPSNIEWAADVVVLPTVTTATLRAAKWHKIESCARGQIIASLGIEGPIRGFTVRNVRPDLALLDDIDSRESAESELQTETRARTLEEDVAGLAGPDRTVARLMLCTLLNHTCIAATYTDASRKPSWRGQRHKLLDTLPERQDLWDHYVSLRTQRGADDPDARAAHDFYLANRAAMDAAAVVTNPHRFDSRPAADGRPKEASALEACYAVIADRGRESFETEYNNNPPTIEDQTTETSLTPHRIQRQLSGYERRHVPPKVTTLVAGVDVRKLGLHWAVFGFEADYTGYAIDYGVFETTGTQYGTDEGADVAVRRAILGLCEQLRQTEYMRPDGGEILPVETIVIDSGWQTTAVYAACAEAGPGVYPSRGHGQSAGCARANFSDIQRRTADRKPGDGWFLKREGRIWLCHTDADRWKRFVHDRFATAPGKPGCFYLHGTPETGGGPLNADERAHHSFARHILAEVEIEALHRGALRRRWKSKSDNNHWLDATALACVGASMRGVRLPMIQTARPSRVPGAAAPSRGTVQPGGQRPRYTLRQLQEAARGR